MNPIETLTPRRRELLSLMARGLTNDEIGQALGIALGTVRTHVSAVLAELDVSNRTEAAAAYSVWEEGRGVRSRPVLAVLPLATLGDGLELSARAITAELTSILARGCWFPVVARTAAEGAQAGPLAAIGRELGASYIIGGTVRAMAAGVRLTVELVTVASGICLWTSRYEVEGREDAVCAEIAAAVYPVLVAAVDATLVGRRAGSAWELAHEGMRLQATRKAQANVQARECFVTALAADPTLVLAHYGYGLCAYDEVLNQWSLISTARARLAACAERCVVLAPHAAEGYYLLGRYHQTCGDHDAAVIALSLAVARNPSFAAAFALLAQVLHLSGRSDEGLEMMLNAQRLGPRAFVAGLAALHFMRGEHVEALAAAERALASAPRYVFPRVLAVASAMSCGEATRAREHAEVLKAQHPGFAPRVFVRTFGASVDAVERIGRAFERLAP